MLLQIEVLTYFHLALSLLSFSGVFKKLVNAGKKKGSEKTKAWAQSVSNHIYWCAATSDGDGELVKQKWLSILNHVVDIHEGHGERFPHCAHDELQEERDWMEKGNVILKKELGHST